MLKITTYGSTVFNRGIILICSYHILRMFYMYDSEVMLIFTQKKKIEKYTSSIQRMDKNMKHDHHITQTEQGYRIIVVIE